jgi:molecular chaperone GrpE
MGKEKQHKMSEEQSGPELAETDAAKPGQNTPLNEDTWQIPGSEAGSDTQAEKILELEESLSESRDKHLRLLAEFDNYKKRTMRERLDLISSASKDMMVSLLPVLDDFDRAKQSADREGLQSTLFDTSAERAESDREHRAAV